jgi:hypothetical protein
VEVRLLLSATGCGAGELDYYCSDMLRAADLDGDGRVSKGADISLCMIRAVVCADMEDTPLPVRYTREWEIYAWYFSQGVCVEEFLKYMIGEEQLDDEGAYPYTECVLM